MSNSMIVGSRSTDEIRSFINQVRMAYLYDQPHERRTERREVERLSVTMPALLTPLDDQMNPSNYQFNAITRDLSEKGVGLVTTSPVGRSHVFLTLEPCYGEIFDVICKVAYCKDFGYYFQVGCEFVMPKE